MLVFSIRTHLPVKNWKKLKKLNKNSCPQTFCGHEKIFFQNFFNFKELKKEKIKI